MSSLLYIASDHPLPEIHNPHEKDLSFNEALAMGVEVPEHLLAPGIDRDRKAAFHWSDREVHIDIDRGTVEDGGFVDDFSILPLSPSAEDIYTTKKHRAVIECLWTQGCARTVLSYLRTHLEAADEVELWRIYMGSSIYLLLFRKDTISRTVNTRATTSIMFCIQPNIEVVTLLIAICEVSVTGSLAGITRLIQVMRYAAQEMIVAVTFFINASWGVFRKRKTVTTVSAA